MAARRKKIELLPLPTPEQLAEFQHVPTPEEIEECEEAKRVGRSHGWDHANYEAAYGKAPKQPPGTPGSIAKTMPWKYRNSQYPSAKAYRDGWKAGVAQYKRENPGG